jgi:hypothetical protein
MDFNNRDHLIPSHKTPERHGAQAKLSSEDASVEVRAAQCQSKDSSICSAKNDREKDMRRIDVSPSSSSGPMSAAAVSAVMGPPPPKDDKKTSRWERWRRDRREARELRIPSLESSRRWKVGNVVS